MYVWWGQGTGEREHCSRESETQLGSIVRVAKHRDDLSKGQWRSGRGEMASLHSSMCSVHPQQIPYLRSYSDIVL